MSTFQLTDRPKLRWPLDTERTSHNGQEVLILTDSERIAEYPAIIPLPLVQIVARLDGETPLSRVLKDFAAQGLTEELLLALIDQLDQLLFLDTPTARAKWSSVRDAFAQAAIRPTALAGLVYPEDAAKLRQSLQQFISDTERRAPTSLKNEHVVAMISPHVDYRRGWQSYGSAYSILEQVERPDVIFLIGTSHRPSNGIFHLANKAFASPIGTLPAASDAIEQLANRFGSERAFREQHLHQREHSLELQLPWLAHRYSNEALPEIVPILVGSFHELVEQGKKPADHGEASEFIGACAEVLRSLNQSGKKVLFFGGVDLAHVGLHFGDRVRVSDTGLPEIQRRDQQLLDVILRGDEDGLFEHIAEDLDARRICGFPSIYTMLAAMRRAGISVRGHQVDYRQAVEPTSDCVVTFASACWTAQ